MPDGISADFSDLLKLAVQIDNAQKELPKGTPGAMRGAAFTARKAWSEGLESSEFPASAASLRYRFGGNGGTITATVQNSQGTPRMQGFVHAREFGSMTVAPGAPAAAAAEVAAADLVKGLGIAGERALQRALDS